MVKYKLLVSPIVFEEEDGKIVYINIPWDIDSAIMNGQADSAEEAVSTLKDSIKKMREVINE